MHLGLPVLVWLLFNVACFLVCKMTAVVYMTAFQKGIFLYNFCTFYMSQQYRTNTVCSLQKEVIGYCKSDVNTMKTTQTTFSPPPCSLAIVCVLLSEWAFTQIGYCHAGHFTSATNIHFV